MDKSELGEKCDYDPCHCVTTEARSVRVGEKSIYCSRGCAEGKGCGHHQCNCSSEAG